MVVSQHVEPVFFKHKDLPADPTRFSANQETFPVLEICLAAERVCGRETVLGAQCIKGLWRIYPLTREARNQLLIEGIVVGGCTVSLHDKNPYIVRGGDGVEVPVTKLFISDIPISVANEDIESALVRLGCTLRSSLLMEKIRNKDGKLTRFITGRRFVYINCPGAPLERSIKVGSFTARLFHKEQPKVSKNLECTNCLQVGHRRFQCQNLVTCKECRQSGHKSGDPACGSFADPVAEHELVLDTVSRSAPVEPVEESANQSEKDQQSETSVADDVDQASLEDPLEVFEESQSEFQDTQFSEPSGADAKKPGACLGADRKTYAEKLREPGTPGKRNRSEEKEGGDSPDQPQRPKQMKGMQPLPRPRPARSQSVTGNQSEGGVG